MSDKDPSTDAGEQLPDLSALNFGPAWARDKPKSKPRARKESSRDDQGSRSSQGGRERGKGRGRGGQGGGHGGDRRQQDRQGGGRDQRGFRGKGRRDDRDDRRGYQRKPMTPAPDGVIARIMPIEEGLDALAKDIAATGRTHSVFDIAWMVLGGLERFHVIFESEEQPLYRSKNDHSLWLYQKECMAHFWSSGIVKKYYDEEIVDVDPPKGNFQSVARCGLSGVLIGPPNHHAYQKNLLELHRQKFSNMALDRYKAKIVMEHGEESVQEWLDSMTKHVRWRPKSEAPEVSSGPAEEKEDEPKNDGETVSESTAESSETAAPAIEETVVILDTRLEVEQHFLTHGFNDEFESGKVLSVLANVPPKMIDPGLLTLLKETVREERRYPGKLASILCRQMSGRHLAVFKWKKHLHCGPARPRKVSDDMVMAERPAELFHWVINNPSGNIDAMWKDLLPSDIDDDTRHLWYHDLHWLINEGIVLLFSDGKLHAAKELQKKTTPKKVEAKKEKPENPKSDKTAPEGVASKSGGGPNDSEASAEQMVAENADEIVPASEPTQEETSESKPSE